MRRFASRPARAGLIVLLLLAAAYVGLLGFRVLYPLDYIDQIRNLAHEHALDPALVAAVVRCESRFDTSAVSPVGAVGLMQIMPETGAWIAEQLGISGFEAGQLTQPDLSLRLGVWYLRHLLDRFGNRSDALRAYNAGPTNAERWLAGDAEVFPETKAYVERVTRSIPVYRCWFRHPWLLRIIPSLLL